MKHSQQIESVVTGFGIVRLEMRDGNSIIIDVKRTCNPGWFDQLAYKVAIATNRSQESIERTFRRFFTN